MARKPKAHPTHKSVPPTPDVPTPISVFVAAPAKPAPVANEPKMPADAGVALYTDRSGPPINTGLTEGINNLATITADARRSVAEQAE